MRRPGKPLSDEDRILWNLVARTVTPLDPAREVHAGAAEPGKAEETSAAGTPQLSPASVRPILMPSYTPPPQPKQPSAPALDTPTLDKLAKGRLAIDGRVDLHGMTQHEAHALLLSFLHRAHLRGARHVLIITGKGNSTGGDGVLRRQVPAWLGTAPFRGLVSTHHPAARHHGGGGALYVRLARVQR